MVPLFEIAQQLSLHPISRKGRTGWTELVFLSQQVLEVGGHSQWLKTDFMHDWITETTFISIELLSSNHHPCFGMISSFETCRTTRSIHSNWWQVIEALCPIMYFFEAWTVGKQGEVCLNSWCGKEVLFRRKIRGNKLQNPAFYWSRHVLSKQTKRDVLLSATNCAKQTSS